MSINLVSLLDEYGCTNLENAKETIITDCKLSILQIRDCLHLMGNILHEDLENQIYVAKIHSGYGNMNYDIIALQLQDKKIYVAGYAKEGIINQNACERAFTKLTDAAHGKKIIPVSRPKWLFPTIFALVIVVAIIAITRGSFIPQNMIQNLTASSTTPTESASTTSSEDSTLSKEIKDVIEATKLYNNAVKSFNILVKEYNNSVSKTCIDNIEGLPSALDSLAIVSEKAEDIADVIEKGNNKDKISKDTSTVSNMSKQVKQLITIVKQITAPDSEWVLSRLNNIDEIVRTQVVTETNDPDGLLDKEGGYSDCIYFTVAAALPHKVPGNSIVEKGIDGGGAVEIYPTLEDAEARVEYLSGFDGTILYSGSYAIVGTMVIRTSFMLTDEQQLNLTNSITKTLTALS